MEFDGARRPSMKPVEWRWAQTDKRFDQWTLFDNSTNRLDELGFINSNANLMWTAIHRTPQGGALGTCFPSKEAAMEAVVEAALAERTATALMKLPKPFCETCMLIYGMTMNNCGHHREG